MRIYIPVPARRAIKRREKRTGEKETARSAEINRVGEDQSGHGRQGSTEELAMVSIAGQRGRPRVLEPDANEEELAGGQLECETEISPDDEDELRQKGQGRAVGAVRRPGGAASA